MRRNINIMPSKPIPIKMTAEEKAARAAEQKRTVYYESRTAILETRFKHAGWKIDKDSKQK
jgi:hypothetical protein